MLRSAFHNRSTTQVIFEDKSKHNCIIRKGGSEDDLQPQISLEMSVRGIFPRQYVYLLDRITDTQLSWNEHCLKCECISRESDDLTGETVDIFATMIKSPAMFISARIFVDARYMLKDPVKDQYIIMFSSRGNEAIAQDYSNTHDLNGSALAHSIISGHWYMPLLDEKTNEVIGTKIFYLSQSDFGGKIP